MYTSVDFVTGSSTLNIFMGKNRLLGDFPKTKQVFLSLPLKPCRFWENLPGVGFPHETVQCRGVELKSTHQDALNVHLAVHFSTLTGDLSEDNKEIRLFHGRLITS